MWPGGLAAKQIPPRPGQAPALGLRAGAVDAFMQSQTISRKEKHHVVLFLVGEAAALRSERAQASIPSQTAQLPAAARSPRRPLAALASRPDGQLAGRLRSGHPA